MALNRALEQQRQIRFIGIKDFYLKINATEDGTAMDIQAKCTIKFWHGVTQL